MYNEIRRRLGLAVDDVDDDDVNDTRLSSINDSVREEGLLPAFTSTAS